jgi:hypothetical protein
MNGLMPRLVEPTEDLEKPNGAWLDLPYKCRADTTLGIVTAGKRCKQSIPLPMQSEPE